MKKKQKELNINDGIYIIAYVDENGNIYSWNRITPRVYSEDSAKIVYKQQITSIDAKRYKVFKINDISLIEWEDFISGKCDKK